MVFVFNTRNVKTMDQTIRDKIINAGVPISFYDTGVLHLGANNSKALRKLANIGTMITNYNLPLPPSLFTEFVCDRTSGKSKQDYRMTIDGEPGMGKSYVSTFLGGRYGIEMGDRFGQDPKDYFSLDNCALLQDTAGVSKLMDECEKFQCVVIDDAGIAAGNRDFLTQSNKNMSAILQVCRTKRWFLIYNMPNRRHVDLQIRELVYSKGYIYKSFHDAGFNVVKINREEINTSSSKNRDFRRRLTMGGKKISFYLSYSTDYLDPYKGLVEEYDILRDKATDDLIHERAGNEAEKKNPVNKKAEAWKSKLAKFYDYVSKEYKAKGDAMKRSDIIIKTGLTDREVLKMIAIYNTGGIKQ